MTVDKSSIVLLTGAGREYYGNCLLKKTNIYKYIKIFFFTLTIARFK